MTVISIWIVAIVALQTAAGHAHGPVRSGVHAAPAVVTHARTATLARRTPAPAHDPNAELDVSALRRHVASVAKLVGHRSHRLVEVLGKAATVGDGMIEWNVADLGIPAGSTYGYATVVRGRITGVFFRGRANADVLRHLRLPHGMQLTEAGGERPAFSIVAGE